VRTFLKEARVPTISMDSEDDDAPLARPAATRQTMGDKSLSARRCLFCRMPRAQSLDELRAAHPDRLQCAARIIERMEAEGCQRGQNPVGSARLLARGGDCAMEAIMTDLSARESCSRGNAKRDGGLGKSDEICALFAAA